MPSSLKIGLASVAGLVAAGGLAVGAAFAQTPTPDGQSQITTWVTRFAQALGKSEAEVKAAAQSATNQTIDAAVAAGRLTAEQAQQLKDRAAQAPFAGPGRGFDGGHRGGKGGLGMMGAELSGLAQFLGMPEADVRTALQSGKTLAQLAQERGKSRDDLKTYLSAQARTRLDQAVRDGKLTQDQANQRLQQMTTELDRLIDGQMPQRGPRGGVGPNGQPNQPSQSGQPSRPGVAPSQAPTGTQSTTPRA